MTSSEKEWIKQSREGNEEAFTQLVERYHPKIYQAALSLLKDPSLAQDVAQESFIRAYKNLKQFRENSSFYTWLWRIAHNICIDMMRKQKPDVVLHEELVSCKATFSDGQVGDLLEFLPSKHRRVFELFYIEKLSQKEIAQQLDLPYGTVRSRLHYAREKLRKLNSKTL